MESPGKRKPFRCGPSIIRPYIKENLSWSRALFEFFDNSIGAGATIIRVRKVKTTVQFIDNGRGCDDLQVMESLGESGGSGDDKASMFGLGGVKCQINLSQGTVVEIESITRAKHSYGRVDWRICLEENEFFFVELEETHAEAGSSTGTTITLHNCRRIQNLDRIKREISYHYAARIKAGLAIYVDVDGKSEKIRPYKHPELVRRVEVDFIYLGHRFTGYCGLVKEGIKNPYPGWSLHWGYRVVRNFIQPAGDRPVSRIYGEIVMPESWRDMGLHKDDFGSDHEGLMIAISEACLEVLDEAEAQSREFELKGHTRELADVLGSVLGFDRRLKGRRPGRAGKEGTVEPADSGVEHRQFATSQPGDKGVEAGASPARYPDTFTVEWSNSIEEIFTIRRSGLRRRGLHLTLNADEPHLALLRARGDLTALAVLCLSFVAKELADGQHRDVLPSIKSEFYNDIYSDLLRRLPLPDAGAEAA